MLFCTFILAVPCLFALLHVDELQQLQLAASILAAFAIPFVFHFAEEEEQQQQEEHVEAEQTTQHQQQQEEEEVHHHEDELLQSQLELQLDGHQQAQLQHVLEQYKKVKERVQHEENVVADAARNVTDCAGEIETHEKTIADLTALTTTYTQLVVKLQAKKVASEGLEAQSRHVLADLQAEELAICNLYPFLQYSTAMDEGMDSVMMEL